MTKEREEAIRRECRDASCDWVLNEIAKTYGRQFVESEAEMIASLNKQALHAYAEGMYRERLRAEELMDLLREAKECVVDDIRICNEHGLTGAANKFQALLSRIEEATKRTEP